jgi:predicted MFS family arabinose efflux permease
MHTDPPVTLETPRRSWMMLGLILLVQIVSPTGFYGLSALAPFILDEWGISRRQYGMIVSAFSTGTFLFAFPAGIFTDRVGVVKILLLGQTLIGIFICLAPWSPGYVPVLAVMFIAGTGYGLLNPAGSKAVYSWFPQHRRGVALSIKQSSLPLCGMLSGLLLPPLSLIFSWRQAWMFAGLATLTTALLTLLAYRDPPFNQVPEVAEGSASPPKASLLRRRAILQLSLAGFMLTCIHISWHSYIAVFLKDHLNMTAVRAGTYLALMQASAIVGRPVLGLISDTLFGGRRRGILVFVGIASLFLGLWLALLPADTPAAWVALALGLFGFTGVSWHGVHLTWMTEIAGPASAGEASGLWIGSCHLAVIVTGPVFGALVDTIGSYSAGWLFTCVLAILVTITLAIVAPEKKDG